MNTKKLSLWAGAALLGLSGFSVQAAPFLFDYGFNIDETDYIYPFDGDSDSRIDLSGFDDITGLGFISATLSGAGSHSFDAIFDHEFTEATNSFFNETGAAIGAPGAGQSWQIDDPVLGFIWDDFDVSDLLNENFLTDANRDPFTGAWDVSLAMGWDFELDPGETATIELLLSDSLPLSDFYLSHSDPDSDENIYLSSSLLISPVSPVPEPSALMLFGIGLLGMLLANRRRITKT